MRILARFTLVLLLALPAFVAHADTLTILHFGDTHSSLAPGGSRDDALRGSIGGIARAASLIGATRAQDPNVLTLHAGDLFIGDIFFNAFFGVPELQLLAALGVDAMALGNHEFDLTPSTLEMAVDEGFSLGAFPLLSANTVFPDTGFVALRSNVKPYTVKDFGSMRVGIFGLTTPSANILSQPAPIIIDENIVAIASEMVDTLRAHECDVIILLSHLGFSLDAVIGASVSGIDVIVGGHDHYLFETALAVPTPSGGTTMLVQAGPFYRNIGRMQLEVDEAGVRMLEYGMIALDATVPEEPQVKELVDTMIVGVEQVFGPMFSQRIGYMLEDFGEVAPALLEPGFKDTPVGNLVTDALRDATGMQIGIEPSGGTADKLFRGPITLQDAFRTVGYGYNTVNGLGFRVATMRAPGVSILAGLEYGLSEIEIGDDNLLQVSGMSYRYDPSKPVGQRLVDAKVGDVPLDPSGSYTIATNEFILQFFELLGLEVSDVRVIEDTTEYQVLAAYIGARDTLSIVRTFAATGRIEALGTDAVDIDAATRSSVVAIGCSPNPISSRGWLRVALRRAADVTVELHDPLGRHVARIAEGRMEPGAHTITIDASGLANGTYICRVTADGVSQVEIVRVMR